MRRTYVYDPTTKEMVDKSTYIDPQIERGHMVFGDLPDLLSPIDGKVIHGRAGMRQHNKMHNVTFTEDFKDQWKRQAKERTAVFEGKNDKNQRREAIARSLERLGGYTPGSKNDFL